MFPDIYEVSDQGQVRSRLREVACSLKCGKTDRTRSTRTRGGKILAIGHGGRTKTYQRVHLRPGTGMKPVWIAVHILVCTTFHGPRPDGMLCCHKDDDQENNRADNLYWGTRAENDKDRRENSKPDAGADTELPGADW
jgi:hypothetical protein